MSETVDLGGNIALTGFSEVDGASMIILKKIVGRYVKDFSEVNTDFKRLELILNNKEPYEMTAVLSAKKEKKGIAADENLFIALDSALKKLK